MRPRTRDCPLFLLTIQPMNSLADNIHWKSNEMALMTWSSKYSVGVKALDNQHQTMMKILNELHAASMLGKAQEVAGPLLDTLTSLANEHFSAEEKLMESVKFPGLGRPLAHSIRRWPAKSRRLLSATKRATHPCTSRFCTSCGITKPNICRPRIANMRGGWQRMASSNRTGEDRAPDSGSYSPSGKCRR